MIRKIFVIASFLTFSQSRVNAICSEVITAKKDENTILFFNDRHVDQVGNKKGLIQRKHIIDYLSQLNGNAISQDDRPFLIAEDMLYCDNHSTAVVDYMNNESLMTAQNDKAALEKTEEFELDQEFSIEQNISVIGNLIVDCKQADVDCYNAECRQTKWVSRNEDFVKGSDIAASFEQNVDAIMKDLKKIKNDAKNNDEAQIIYDACVEIMQKNEQAARQSIEYLKNCDISLKELENENSEEFVHSYSPLHDLHLIDARLLIGWYNNRSRSPIAIVAGEVHIENIMPVFEKLGFTSERYGEKYSADDQGMMLTVQNAMDFAAFFNEIDIQEYQPFTLAHNETSTEPLFENIIASNMSTIDL